MSRWDPGPDIVALPDGTKIRARPRRSPVDVEPEFGLYLCTLRPLSSPWDSGWIWWPDFGLPLHTDGALATLRDVHERARSERVEVACRGGVGRTGTAIALLAILSGVEPAHAVPWVRENYRPAAVETPWQRRWVTRVGHRM